MQKLSETLILTTAEQMIEASGMEKVSLSNVAERLGTSHAALYKYFQNKKDLWGALSIKWLDTILSETFSFDAGQYSDKVPLIHDWLWSLSRAKYESFVNDPKMFALYTTYVDNDEALLARHMQDLNTKLVTLTGLPEQAASNIIMTFSWFTAPAFSKSWGQVDFKGQFENMWQFVSPAIKALL
ncbi:TetR/AcrR family transcriptional regulator [Oenococcus sp.]|uniref:TetR/AcrR family transcriptional regulator n=1 Tax=Oenococcus sp. TaxID=1979414 RepID=UPI0039E7ABEC